MNLKQLCAYFKWKLATPFYPVYTYTSNSSYAISIKWQFHKTVVNFFLLVQNFANKNVCWDMPRSDDLYHNFTYKSSVVF